MRPAVLEDVCKMYLIAEEKKELDSTAADIANRQDESDASRKRLVEQSRDFKKNTNEDTRKIVAPLLKSFQAEVDALSKRSKFAECAFFSIYKRLIDLPDQVAVFEQALQVLRRAQKVSDLEIENKQLRETLHDYNTEFADVKNQEVTIKQLKEKLREYDDKLETTVEIRIKDKERELQRLHAKKEHQLHETQQSVAGKLVHAERKIISLQSTLEDVQSELFDLKTKYDEATSAKSDEMDLIMSELDRANEHSATSQREAEQLRIQLHALRDSGNIVNERVDGSMPSAAMEREINTLCRSNLEVELSAKEKEVAQLVVDVQKLQASLSNLRKSTALKVAQLEQELDRKNRALAVLEEKLSCHDDYEEIKRELSVLKSMEFSGPSLDSMENDKGTSLEMLLLQKNRALLKENTQLRLSNSDLTGPENAQPSSSVSPAANLSSSVESGINRNSSITSSSTFAQLVGEELVHSYRPHSSLPVSSIGSIVTMLQHTTSPPHTVISSAPSVFASCTGVTCTASVPSVGVMGLMQFPMAPPSPFFGFHGLPAPFHPAFMPVNMVKSEQIGNGGCGPVGLDTHIVAKNVRELLAVHNIGQRLFAKHVLGLSQGTVSELLSKPKSWDKLTEKGRESYRKMHAWAIEDANVLALKAMSPRKNLRVTGSSTLPTSGPKDYSPATKERIVCILNEAQHAIHTKKANDRQNVRSVAVSNGHQVESSRIPSTSVMLGAQKTLAAAHPSTVSLDHPAVPNTNSQQSLSTRHPPVALPASLHRSPVKRDGEECCVRGSDEYRDHSCLEGENSQDMVVRIYRQELEKLKAAADSAGNLAASGMYAHELDRLQHEKRNHQLCKQRSGRSPRGVVVDQQRHDKLPILQTVVKAEPTENIPGDTASQSCLNFPIDLSSKTGHISPSSSSLLAVEDSAERFNSTCQSVGILPHAHNHINGYSDSDGEASPHSTSASGTPLDGVTTGMPESLSPLQRMQNIANSFTSRHNLAVVAGCRPLRTVLPPVSQEEFDLHANVNTEELVKMIKEMLSQYSISQRLFGESVLGLSQGSVSDLLARPKPWHMLTQKGREPFIRMQMFMKDAEAIPKLVSTQYRIAPDKLLHSNSRPEAESSLTFANISTNASISVDAGFRLFATYANSINASPPLPNASHAIVSSTSSCVFSNLFLASLLKSPPVPQSNSLMSPMGELPLVMPPSQSPHCQNPVRMQNSIEAYMDDINPVCGLASNALSQQNPWGCFAFPSSLLEVLAMTSEIDTLSLTAKVKDMLQFHNLGQKLFGEVILGLSQGSVSELLSKPKPWHMLSIKGREPFIKMNLWLERAQSVEQLKSYQSLMKAGHRRGKSSPYDHGFDSPNTPKRPRVFFSEEQKEKLRVAYKHDPYPNQLTIENLAADLGVGVKTVINWFHNHRMRAKQQQHQPGIVDVKAESVDDNSSHSDMSSMSSDALSSSCQQAVAAAAAVAMRQVEASQWLFPKFESSGFLHLQASKFQRSEDWDEDGVDERMDETDGAATKLCSDNASKVQTVTCSAFPEALSVTLPQLHTDPLTLVNKRKRSYPQRVFEGGQFDRSQSTADLPSCSRQQIAHDDDCPRRTMSTTGSNTVEKHSAFLFDHSAFCVTSPYTFSSREDDSVAVSVPGRVRERTCDCVSRLPLHNHHDYGDGDEWCVGENGVDVEQTLSSSQADGRCYHMNNDVTEHRQRCLVKCSLGEERKWQC